ncbi:MULTISPECIES: hypothetical protein [unclassified Streptomyces]|uniref:beta strand repeat-containing protein n=1 Tax=unclassified Streptomyces TaxID=2593676 RepID=UPI002E823D9C|nr:hypothetical protein [Streptomyces sp. NBC_00589]WTI37436.1 gp58-like family protein [Streptomyces sp. NBC_00775]WUB28887.1 gp58-like family protein [Streptomyces sp. NBC_00589]
MADTLAVLAGRIANLERLVRDLSRTSRLANSSIENGSIAVYDDGGVLRGSIGLQQDGTVALAAVNGPTPPVPTAPTIASVLGGVAVTWDGLFADGSQAPADFAYVEVHFSTSVDFPDSGSLFAAFYSTHAATMTVPASVPVWVRLVCVSTSGAASVPSAVAGPAGPQPVVAQSVLDGIVDELALADGAVTAAKIETGAVGSVALADSAVLEGKLAKNAVSVGKLADGAVSDLKLADDAVTEAKLAAGAVGSTSIQDGAITTPKMVANSISGDRIAAGTLNASKIVGRSITAAQIQALAITGAEIAAGTITANQIAAGAITTDKLTVVGGANVLSDPSFEGPYTAALVAAAGTSWSVDTKGNGSPKSIKVNAVASTATTRGLGITSIPILAGDQLYLAYDYQASSDYNGTVKLYAQWLDSSGTTLTWGVVQASPPVLGATWQRLTGTVTAPANTVKALIVAESFQASAGTVWWDNAAVRPVLPGTMIADGAITTPKLVANAISGDRIAAGTLDAAKIVGKSLTAAQIQGLAITADLIAGNTITADKLFAGTITAASGVISSIDASKITTGTLDASKAAITNLNASAITAGTISVDRLSVGLQGSIGQKFYDFGDSATKWLNSASGTMTTVAVADAQSGGNVMRCVGFVQGAYRPDVKIPFDPAVTYRVSIRVRQTVANSTPGTNQKTFMGVAGLAADGVTFVNLTGANSLSSQFYVAADGEDLTAGAGWRTFTGYIKGTSASPVRMEAPNANAPAQLHSSVRYITPLLYLNYTGGTGTVEVDMFAIEVVEAGGIAASNIKAGAIDGQTITGAVLRAVRADGSVAALMAPDVGDGSAGFRTTSADGTTYAQLESGEVTFGAAGITQVVPTGITGKASGGTLDIQSGMIAGGAQAHIILASGDSPLAPGNGAPFISLEWDGDSGTSNPDMVVDVSGILAPRNFAWGRATISPVANTPTSVTVTGLHIRGTTFRGLATAATTVPGTQVTGVGTSSVTATSATIWCTRTNTNTTFVDYLLLGS